MQLRGLTTLTVSDVHGYYDRNNLDDWSDAALVAAVAAVISVPKEAPADSFVLHAPLELLARSELLRHVRPAQRRAARERIVWLAAAYNEAGPPVASAATVGGSHGIAYASIVDAAASLRAAIAGGDLDDVDRAASWLGAHATTAELRAELAGIAARSLAAAGHAPILLYLMPYAAVPATALLRPLARELARHPEWQLRWFDDVHDAPHPVRFEEALLDALLDAPALGIPGSTFIYPTMAQVQDTGVASRLLGPACHRDLDVGDVAGSRRVLLRVAAWSMLQEPDDHAPYGWSHCMTMPQAVLGVAGGALDARTAIAVAATYVLGFRTSIGQKQITALGPPTLDGDDDVRNRFETLAVNASRHHDAHLVKYTLACIHAAASDPEYAALYADGAQRLATWWSMAPDDEFFGG